MLVLGEFPLLGWNGALKQVIDVSLAGAGLLVLSPALGLLALSSSSRAGVRSSTASCASAATAAASRCSSSAPCAPQAESAREPFAAQRNDPRGHPATGRWLLRSSLDELPQLLNVLARRDEPGRAASGAPRASSSDSAEEIPRYMRGTASRPGVTGWAQINGSRRRRRAERVAFDLYYIENWSPGARPPGSSSGPSSRCTGSGTRIDLALGPRA